MARHHLIITGTGRAGTTFLVHLFTLLRLDTGFANPCKGIDRVSHAGLEKDLRSTNAPYIVKSPWMFEYLDDLLSQGQVIIDHAIIPMRELYSAAESRRDVSRRFGSKNQKTPGGLWLTKDPAQQEAVLLEQFYRLSFTLAKYSVPFTLLHFPRSVTDPQYVYQQLPPQLSSIGYEDFRIAFSAISRPEMVHNYEVDVRSQ